MADVADRDEIPLPLLRWLAGAESSPLVVQGVHGAVEDVDSDQPWASAVSLPRPPPRAKISLRVSIGSYVGAVPPSPDSESEQLLLGDFRSADVTVGDLRPQSLLPSPSLCRWSLFSSDSLLRLCSLLAVMWFTRGTAGGDMLGKDSAGGGTAFKREDRVAAIGRGALGLAGTLIEDASMPPPACRKELTWFGGGGSGTS